MGWKRSNHGTRAKQVTWFSLVREYMGLGKRTNVLSSVREYARKERRTNVLSLVHEYAGRSDVLTYLVFYRSKELYLRTVSPYRR